MGIYVYNRKTLDEQLSDTSAVDFGKDVFPKSLESYRVQAFPFDGYWEDIGTVHSFHEANLQMASPTPPFNFNSDSGIVYTNVRTLPPTGVGKLTTENSLITEGCRVGEATLKSCVLGIRSIVGNNVRLSRSLVMGADYYETTEQIQKNLEIGRPNIGIGDNVIIEDAIVDKNVRIGSDVIIRNPASVDPVETDMYAVRDGIICLVKHAIIPSGTRIGR
jgi:glucose-1-phosphate adenylyltransferase